MDRALCMRRLLLVLLGLRALGMGAGGAEPHRFPLSPSQTPMNVKGSRALTLFLAKT